MLKILIVDDEPFIVNGLIHILNSNLDFDNTIITAYNASDGLTLANEHKPDVIITDINMPIMSGLDMLKDIKEMDLCKRYIILSGYDDFQYAKEALRLNALDYLMKPVKKNELLALLKGIQLDIGREKQTRKQEMLYHIKHYMFYKDSISLQLIIDDYNDYFTHHQNSLLVMSMDTYNKIKDNLQTYVNELSIHMYELSLTHKNEIVLIVNYKESMDFQTFKTMLETEEEIGISSPFSSLYHLPSMYLEAIHNILLQKQYDVSLRQPTLTLSASSYYQELCHAIENKSCEDTLRIIKGLINYLIQESKDETQLTYYLYFYIISNLNIYIKENNILEIETSTFSLYKTPNCKLSFLELNQIIKDIIEIIKQLSKQYDHDYKHCSEHIQKAIDYIHSSYSKDISLHDISTIVNLNVCYISSIFKQEIGQSFLSYLNQYRINKAILLIKNDPTLSFSNIAALVGYKEVRYFYRVFKLQTGMTPGEFRKKENDEAIHSFF